MNRDQILGARDLVIQDVPVPEWNGTVKVRMLTVAERDRVSQAAEKSPAEFRAALVVSTLLGDDGERIFADDETALVLGKSSAAVDRIFLAAARLNRIVGDAVGDAEKNSDAATSGASSSASPSRSGAPSASSESASTPQS